jgi:Na+/H+ antiporter NhaA
LPLNKLLAGKGISMSKFNQSSKIKNPVLFGIAMGIAMGASLGVALSSVTFGVSIGIAMSVAFWASAKKSKK